MTSLQDIQHEPATKRLKIEDQVALDLATYIDKFPNKSFAIRILAKETGLNQKTIKRLLSRQNTPSYQTLFQLYSVFLGTSDYQCVLEKSPQVVRELIERYNPSATVAKYSHDKQMLELMQREPVMAEIYVLIGTGVASKKLIAERYGQYGLNQVETLCKLNIVHLVDKDTYQIAPDNPSMDPQMIQFLGELFTRRFCKPVSAQLTNRNFLAFYAEGLNEEGRKLWLSIDDAAFDKKLEIARNPKYKGDIPMFTFTSTDSMRTLDEEERD